MFSLPGYEVRRLASPDREQFQRLHERCGEYILLISGAPPTTDDAQRLLDERPPKTEEGDKFVLGVQGDGKLVAVIDLIRDYPTAGTWWVGNMMVDPCCRGGGFGTGFYRTCEAWMEQRGARQIGLCVQEQNVAAAQFWTRMGFQQTGEAQQRIGDLESTVAIMYRDLAAEPVVASDVGPG
jgi:GNAT superfamily N-acetyltransferase